MEHLTLEILSREKNGASQYAWLPENASISITDTSEIFDKGNLWSHDFQLNIPANAHIFGTAGELHGSRLHEQIDKRKARLWVEGLPLFLGYLRLADEVEVDKDGNVDVTFESGQKTFEEMIEGAKANQVPIPDDILIGMAVDRERELLRLNAEIKITHRVFELFGGYTDYTGIKNVRLVSKDFKSQIFPKFVRPDGTWKESDTDDEYTLSVADTINTDIAYDDGHPYCNVTICYQDREYKSNGSSMEENAIRGYHVSSPRRINPAPNFYVLYWFKLLMKHLGITIQENQMLNVEDLCRLFFVNTKCAYKTKDDKTYRGDYMPFGKSSPFVPQPSTEEPSWSINAEPTWEKSFFEALDTDEAVMTNVGVGVENITWQPAYATSGNFPDVDIQEVINGLESGFGVRLAFNKDYTLVRVLLLRNIFRSQDIQVVQGTIISAEKRDNCVRGFRLTYGGGEDNTAYNYKGFLLAKKKNEGNWELPPEAHDYTKFEFHENYTPILNNAKRLSPTCYVAMNTGNSYVVKIDEDFKDASNDPFPSLFECAQYMDAEDGNCTGEDETIEEVHINFTPAIMSAVDETSGAPSTDTLIPSIDYSRVGMNYAFFISKEMGVPYKNADAAAQYLGQSNNYKRAIDTTPSEFLEKMKDSLIQSNGGYTNTKEEPQYRSGLLEVATPVSFKATDENGNETISFTKNGRTLTYKLTGWIREGYRLYLDDNFKITDEMLSPLEDMDWGLSLGILRGSTSSLYAGRTIYESDTEEGEGNDYWITMPGDAASANPDICNDMGELWLRSTMQPFTGYEYGDKLLAEAGCTNQCDLKTRKGPHPRRPDVYSIIDTYYTSDRPRLLLLSNEGYYATADTIMSAEGDTYTIWLCCVNGNNALMRYDFMQEYISYLQNGIDNTPPTDIDTILARDAAGHTWQGIYASNMIIGINPTKPSDVLKNVATNYNEGNAIVCYDYDDETSTSGAVSLKLRAEKPNPDFDPKQPESENNRRYLEITNPRLRGRGLMDQFYKEYSYWVRNARIARMTVRMELAQLLNIDKTKRVRVGNIIGFIRKMEYQVSNQSGLGLVTMEIMYI